jgi:hypothetical protein
MELPSMIAVEVGGDAEGGRDRYLDLDYGLRNGTRLLLSLGSTSSDEEPEEIITGSGLLGFRTDPLLPWSGGAELEHWGKKGVLTTDTLRLVVDFNATHWALSLRPQWRKLTFYSNCIPLLQPLCKPEYEVGSNGLAIDLGYYSDGPWGVSLGVAHHNYDRDVSGLSQYPAFQLIFSADTLDLATSLEDHRVTLSASYVEGANAWLLSRLHSVSAVDSVESVATSLRYSRDLDAQWRLRLRAGWQNIADSEDRVGFGGVGIAYQW